MRRQAGEQAWDLARNAGALGGLARGVHSSRPTASYALTTSNTSAIGADAAAAGDLDLPKAHSILNELRAYHHQVAHAVVEPAGHSVLVAMLDRYLDEFEVD